ncbi:MAG: DegT/DnrJ/EryC1/StrS family aminotransferase [Firmicutes bacterium]|nr:DegT/DnrJ/EryC1/StrS family aminotransferase [Bacillota bacterium]
MYRIGKEEVAAAERVIMNGNLFRINTDLREVLQFEKELAEKMGANYSLYVTSGTSALVSILGALGLGPGDEVIVPSYTFIASPNAVLSVGAIPVVAEVDETLTMDPEDVRKKITDRTKVIMPVHLCGFPCDMDAIMKIAREHNLYVVEDACQADGASYKGKRLGTIGRAGAMSFNYYKIISAGEGGAVLTDDPDLYEKALIYHDVGSSYWSYERELAYPFFVGSQFRGCEVMAAIMRVQLGRLDGLIAELRGLKRMFNEKIRENTDLLPAPSHDAQGDLGSTWPLRFDSEKKARAFAANLEGCVIPYDVNRHVFIHWKPILEKRVTNNPYMNPYNMERNQNRKFDITADSAPSSLDYLSRTAYVPFSIDYAAADVDALVARCARAAEQC